RHRLEVGPAAGAVRDAERDAGTAEEPQERRSVVARVSDLERIAKWAIGAHVDVGPVAEPAVVSARERRGRGGRPRQDREERLEARGVEGELRRQLPEDRPELLL